MFIHFEIVRWFWLVTLAGLLSACAAFVVCISISHKHWGYSKRQAIWRLALASLLTVFLWPVSVLRRPISESYAGISQDAYSQIHSGQPWPSWNYYGLPFPMHRSHAYLPHLTISIQRYPIVESVFLNVVFWFILFHGIKKPRREQRVDPYSSPADG